MTAVKTKGALLSRRSMQRARSIDEKEVRRAQIMTGARHLLVADGMDRLSMDGVAARAKIAKGTLYLYFPTREALILALHEEDWMAWFDAADHWLGRQRRLEARALIDWIADYFSKHAQFAETSTRLHSVLERNVPEDFVLGYKLRMAERLKLTGALLEQHWPALGQAGGARFLVQAHAVLIGVWLYTHPAPVLENILKRPELSAGRQSFKVFLESVLLPLCRAVAG